ncbi:hypothetical protein WICMUC_000693 [Wickerhamomyces mucosus]|uniref:Alpha-1,3-mannosyltransferase n=1 Tax=Wickerhamomyces mucosus TaxID=1378264 RepID=A0A9P8PYM6_9ASCO|nr:hypothetical protein WICMUC_000693 [Wickerhamomyces mucosus]
MPPLLTLKRSKAYLLIPTAIIALLILVFSDGRYWSTIKITTQDPNNSIDLKDYTFPITDSENILKKIPSHASVQEKCTTFFDVDTFKKTTYSSFNFEDTSVNQFFESHIKKKFKYLSDDDLDSLAQQQFEKYLTPDEIDLVIGMYNDNFKKNLEVLKEIKEQTLQTRIFNECYIKHGFQDLPCNVLQKKLFPWLSNKSPFSEFPSTHPISRFDGNDECILQHINQKSVGKGIVLTASNSHYDDLTSLILILRVLGNTLPIEIIHRGDFSERRQKNIQLLSKNERLSSIIKDKLGIKVSGSLPEQEIRFINIQDSIDSRYRSKFKRFSNKLLASLFNSFHEVVIMDTDVIPFTKPQEFFKFPSYTNSGAWLFKDRTVIYKHGGSDKNFWLNLTPTDAEKRVFDISNPLKERPELIENNRYFQGFSHLVEAGIVVLKKQDYLNTLITSIQFQLWDTAMKRVWGDKEYFWLSFYLNGLDSFTLNQNYAGAAGEVRDIPEELVSKIPRTFNEKEVNVEGICSIQPVHVHDSQLLWMNSGYKFCKKPTYALADKKYYPQLSDAETIKKYKSSIKIKQVLIPPDMDDFYISMIGRSDHDIPWKGWYYTELCAHYTFCAIKDLLVEIEDDKDLKGSEVRDGKNVKEYNGQLITFDIKQSKFFDELGELWMNSDTVFRSVRTGK